MTIIYWMVILKWFLSLSFIPSLSSTPLSPTPLLPVLLLYFSISPNTLLALSLSLLLSIPFSLSLPFSFSFTLFSLLFLHLPLTLHFPHPFSVIPCLVSVSVSIQQTTLTDCLYACICSEAKLCKPTSGRTQSRLRVVSHHPVQCHRHPQSHL